MAPDVVEKMWEYICRLVMALAASLAQRLSKLGLERCIPGNSKKARCMSGPQPGRLRGFCKYTATSSVRTLGLGKDLSVTAETTKLQKLTQAAGELRPT